MTSIIIMDVWKNTGFFMIIFIAALQGVPKPLMEAAAMDGTPAWRRFFRITLPYISPVVFFAVIYASIGALQVFESIVILTQGGPGDATRSLSILIVEQGFGSFQIGYAAAISVVMTLIILAITAVQQVLSRKWVQQ
jgi:multiple sugar transport system permease protein